MHDHDRTWDRDRDPDQDCHRDHRSDERDTPRGAGPDEPLSTAVASALGDSEFALCLTHDIDRPYKRHQALYNALTERPLYHLRTLLSAENPYWQFGEIMALEDDFGVRSAFYVLDQPGPLSISPSAWLDPERWIQILGGYDVTRPALTAVLGQLDERGWEVGLHGSIAASRDTDRLRSEKAAVEAVLDHSVSGVRQHYLRHDGRDTWRRQAELGLEYDCSLGSGETVGFTHGYAPHRPFGDDFLVFPLTLMEQALPDPDDRFEQAWSTCERLLIEAAANDAVMTVLWHPRYFNTEDFPGYRGCYERLIERAQELDAWIGPPGDLYDRLDVSVRASGMKSR